MRQPFALGAALLLGCAASSTFAGSPAIPVAVVSHNRSDVDVYLLCGGRDAQLLGVIHSQETQMYDIPASRARCVQGLNFFLVHRNQNRGYWVGPIYPKTGFEMGLTIEKYAGLSTVRLIGLP